MKNIAIIPARSGSKGLPNKNILELCGKPLLAYSIEAALQSGMFEIVHVSTDSVEYAEIAKNYGADVPFLRSEVNSSDTASSWNVVREALEKYKSLKKEFDNVMLLQPTSPLRTSNDIVAAFTLMEEKKAKSIVSVCQADCPPMWCNKLPQNHAMTDFIKNESVNVRRQNFDMFYRINGAIFLINTDCILNDQNIYRNLCFAYIMDKNRSIDIDDDLDFFLAEATLIYENKLR